MKYEDIVPEYIESFKTMDATAFEFLACDIVLNRFKNNEKIDQWYTYPKGPDGGVDGYIKTNIGVNIVQAARYSDRSNVIKKARDEVAKLQGKKPHDIDKTDWEYHFCVSVELTPDNRKKLERIFQEMLDNTVLRCKRIHIYDAATIANNIVESEILKLKWGRLSKSVAEENMRLTSIRKDIEYSNAELHESEEYYELIMGLHRNSRIRIDFVGYLLPAPKDYCVNIRSPGNLFEMISPLSDKVVKSYILAKEFAGYGIKSEKKGHESYSLIPSIIYLNAKEDSVMKTLSILIMMIKSMDNSDLICPNYSLSGTNLVDHEPSKRRYPSLQFSIIIDFESVGSISKDVFKLLEKAMGIKNLLLITRFPYVGVANHYFRSAHNLSSYLKLYVGPFNKLDLADVNGYLDTYKLLTLNESDLSNELFDNLYQKRIKRSYSNYIDGITEGDLKRLFLYASSGWVPVPKDMDVSYLGQVIDRNVINGELKVRLKQSVSSDIQRSWDQGGYFYALFNEYIFRDFGGPDLSICDLLINKISNRTGCAVKIGIRKIVKRFLKANLGASEEGLTGLDRMVKFCELELDAKEYLGR